jgi:hypothetical protein
MESTPASLVIGTLTERHLPTKESTGNDSSFPAAVLDVLNVATGTGAMILRTMTALTVPTAWEVTVLRTPINAAIGNRSEWYGK